eukprot:CFRG0019T1
MTRAPLLKRSIANATMSAKRAITGRSIHSAQAVTGKAMTYDTINHAVRNAEYAVRGAIPLRAEQLKVIIEKEPGKLPYSKIIHCNIGNPQALRQKPISFFRQVVSLSMNPELLKEEKREDVLKLYPQDAIDRALTYFGKGGIVSTGAYSHSQGIPLIRENIAKFIEERDGFPTSSERVFLTNGASAGVHMMLNLLTANPKVGVMIPIPQYPLYSATMAMVNGTGVPYFLDEQSGWSISIDELERAREGAESLCVDTKALVIINPGNPTGQCLTWDQMESIIKFCHKHKLLLMADEVYQANIYNNDLPFHSFRKVLKSMEAKYQSLELVSFHSTSKGMVGECGMRGGYMHLTNILPEVQAEIYKCSSVQLCPNVPGQIMCDLMVNPPVEGDTSYDQFKAEDVAILESLKRRSQRLVEGFNTMEGITCEASNGAMYTFPRIVLPQKAIDEAQERGIAPDAYYCLQLLEETGVCTVPGSGFKQVPGTFHFRATFLPLEEDFDTFIGLIRSFHEKFMAAHK